MLPYTTYLIDLDGVIYRGNELLPGAQEFVAWLEKQQKKYLYLTNNSFASSAQVLAKLKRLGLPADEAHLLTAGQAAVQYLARRFPKGVIYVVGEMPLLDLVEAYGMTVAPVDSLKADAVLVGLDRDFDYMKLNCAMNAVRAGTLFVAINRDPVLPVKDGLIPGCGTMVAAIEAGSGISPEVVGKPEPRLLQEAMRLLYSQPGETVMIGDSLGVDILAGKNAGTHTLLVLSGSSSRADLANSKVQPDHVYDDIAAVVVALEHQDS